MAKPSAKLPFWGTFLQLFDTICPIYIYQGRKNGGLFVFVFIRGAKRHYLALTGLLEKKGLQALHAGQPPILATGVDFFFIAPIAFSLWLWGVWCKKKSFRF